MLPYQLIVEKSLDEIEFEAPIMNAPLSSSLRIALHRIEPAVATAPEPARAVPTTQATPTPAAELETPIAARSSRFNTAEISSIANILLALAVLAIGGSRAVSQALQPSSSSIFAALSVDAIMIIGVGLLLLCYNIVQWNTEIRSKKRYISSSKSTADVVPTTADRPSPTVRSTITVQLTLLSHSLTSPDLPIVELDDGDHILPSQLLV